jgi:hypothetical protein
LTYYLPLIVPLVDLSELLQGSSIEFLNGLHRVFFLLADITTGIKLMKWVEAILLHGNTWHQGVSSSLFKQLA